MPISSASRALTTLFCPVALLTALSASAETPALSHQERGSLILEGIPAPDEPLAARLSRYRQSRQATFLDWLPDGAMLVATRFGDVEQVHRVATPLGMREQLTFYSEPIPTARAPQTGSGTSFVFLKDQGGDENSQLYYYAP